MRRQSDQKEEVVRGDKDFVGERDRRHGAFFFFFMSFGVFFFSGTFRISLDVL